jgi:hypothetical protein
MRFLGPADVERELAAVVALSPQHSDGCVTLRMVMQASTSAGRSSSTPSSASKQLPRRQPQHRGRSPAAFMTELLGQGLDGRRLPSQRRFVNADASIHRVRTEVRAIRGGGSDEL